MHIELGIAFIVNLPSDSSEDCSSLELVGIDCWFTLTAEKCLKKSRKKNES